MHYLIAWHDEKRWYVDFAFMRWQAEALYERLTRMGYRVFMSVVTSAN